MPDAIYLETGQSETIEVDSELRWNNTNVSVFKDFQYLLEAEGKWIDGGKNNAGIPSGPDGFKVSDLKNVFHKIFMGIGSLQMRMNGENYFALIGSINKNEKELFLIGKGRNLTAKKTGILYCFANDYGPTFPFDAYKNNLGKIKLKITRIK